MKEEVERLQEALAPRNYRDWKCRWLHCAHGMGLAGVGQCAAFGECWNENCPKFITDEDYEREMFRQYVLFRKF